MNDDNADREPTATPAGPAAETGAADAAPTQENPEGWAPERSRKKTIFFAVAIVLGALAALYAWQLPPFRSDSQTTDNAYVRGQTTIISPQVGGYVTQVLVQDFEHVAAGRIDLDRHVLVADRARRGRERTRRRELRRALCRRLPDLPLPQWAGWPRCSATRHGRRAGLGQLDELVAGLARRCRCRARARQIYGRERHAIHADPRHAGEQGCAGLSAHLQRSGAACGDGGGATVDAAAKYLD